jgi:hypothetical protein
MMDKDTITALQAAADPKCGLYEIAWAMDSHQQTGTRVDAAKQAVRALIEAGYIELHRGEWNRDEELGPYPEGEWQALLDDPYVWGKPHAGWYVIAKLTAAGRSAFENVKP